MNTLDDRECHRLNELSSDVPQPYRSIQQLWRNANTRSELSVIIYQRQNHS